MQGCVCMASVFDKKTLFQNLELKKEDFRGAENITTVQHHCEEVQCAEQCPEIKKDVFLNYLLYF